MGRLKNKTFVFVLLSTKEIGQFQKIVGGLIELVDQLAKEAENEKNCTKKILMTHITMMV